MSPPTKAHRILLLGLMSLLGLSVLAAAQGQSSEKTPALAKAKPDTVTVAPQKKPVSQQKSAPTKSKARDERFKPTEEISEDLPVAFPVDI